MAEQRDEPREAEYRIAEGMLSELEDSLVRRVAEAGVELETLGPALGTVIDGTYRLEALVGRGGMGCVFAARHVTTGRRVAIKWMLGHKERLQLSQRFVREARAAGRVRHPNVIDIYDVVSRPDATYLVLELLEGQSLRERLRAGALDPAHAIAVARGVLAGLREAHRHGVIHRDLKPENIFLCRAPHGAKLVDFGISVLGDPSTSDDSRLTVTGCFVGTPVYTALERLREQQPFDHRVDFYSLGVVLYEALTGELPFAGKTPSELAYQIATSAPRPLRGLRPDLPESLEAVVLTALARDAADRYADADAFSCALRPVHEELEVMREARGAPEVDFEAPALPAQSVDLAQPSASFEQALSRESAQRGRVKGALLVHLRDYANEHHGPQAWQDVLDQLSEEDRAQLSSLLLVGSWYPLGLWNRSLRTYLTHNFSSPGVGMTDFGQYVAGQDLTTLFKLVLRLGSPDRVVARTASLYNRYFDSGTWTPEKLGPRHWRCVLVVPDEEECGPGPLSCSEGITAWVRRALEITGTRANVDKTHCRFWGAAACEYVITWNEARGRTQS